MSKKVKGSSAKKSKSAPVKKVAVKKAAPKKPAKTAAKAVSKPVAKKVAPKKANISKKLVPKKVGKVVPVKKAIAKAASKKVVEAVKKPLAKAVKKVTPKKVSLVSKKIQVKSKSKPVVAKKAVSAVLLKPAKSVPNKVVAKVEKAEVKAPVKREAVVKEVASKANKKEAATPKDVIAINNTIPKVERVELSASKIASITSSITNPVKRSEAYAVKLEKEPNGKFEMEYITRASAEMLYEFLATPSGLSEWFCDDVNIRNGIYTFIWDGQMQQARLLKTIDEQLVRFQWVDKVDGSYFEFRIQRDELTNDISLIIVDFADSKSDQESAKLLWNNQVDKLMHVLGSVY